MRQYVHGYSQPESQRLSDQANTLAEIIHNEIVYQPGELILEAGCGVGAQTVYLAKNSPRSNFICIDQSPSSIQPAEQRTRQNKLDNVKFRHMDIFDLDFPDIPAIKKVVRCLVDLQAQSGGDSLIGRRLYPLLDSALFNQIKVYPLMIYVDDSKPELVEGFSKNTFIAMVEGVKDRALEEKMVSIEEWDCGINALYRVIAGREWDSDQLLEQVLKLRETTK